MKKKSIKGQVQPVVRCFCPQCHEEQLDVRIIENGKNFYQDYGICHWFRGYGKCSCGYEGEYGDSSI